jgi:hypothetical protein
MNETRQLIKFTLRQDEKIAKLSSPPNSIQTLVYRCEAD